MIFPGVGLGALVSGAERVTDSMFTAAARALAGSVSEDELGRGQVYPSVSRLREVTRAVAEAVVAAARESGVATGAGDGDIPELIDRSLWEPVYPELVPV